MWENVEWYPTTGGDLLGDPLFASGDSLTGDTLAGDSLAGDSLIRDSLTGDTLGDGEERPPIDARTSPIIA